MHICNDITIRQATWWADFDDVAIVTYLAPPDLPDAHDCRSIVTSSDGYIPVVRTPWKPTDNDLELLANGGTIWLSTWNGLPPHSLEVAPA